ncbi:MAG: UDP-N-acetylglucosamine--N-acetylmuramyl-(pentapeptide) pyrophosphoryl-undecaprenol N-acetylglucosamine transferase, partial [Chitinophagaceae bacterium]
WQTGKPYKATAAERAKGKAHVYVNDFITQMEYAYAAADIVISRSGAMATAELCIVKKPVLFVPYPFAAEDHQTANAKTLVNQGAAEMLKDSEALQMLVPSVIALAKDGGRQQQLSANIATLAVGDAAVTIATEILKTLNNKNN